MKMIMMLALVITIIQAELLEVDSFTTELVSLQKTYGEFIDVSKDYEQARAYLVLDGVIIEIYQEKNTVHVTYTTIEESAK